MSYRVLVVDDSPVMRRFIHRVIIVSGFDCTACLEAGDGQEALELLGQESVDVIVTDINMPRMNGVELVRRLEQNDELRSIPVVVVSTDSTLRRINQMLSLGARAYVTKPFLPETLRDELDRLLEVNHG